MAQKKKSAPGVGAAPKSPKKAAKFDKVAAAERVGEIYPILRRTYPNAGIALTFGNPLELLIATILSAQCTDERVNV